MSGHSLTADLSQRVQRFGKSSKKVPGTYMSAAGIQSEIHPTTLARLAVHEAKYRKQVHVYRQDLQNTVYKIRRDQRMLRSVDKEYKRIHKHNLTHRLIYTPMLDEIDGYILDTNIAGGKRNVLKLDVKLSQKRSKEGSTTKKVKIVLPPIETILDKIRESGNHNVDEINKHNYKEDENIIDINGRYEQFKENLSGSHSAHHIDAENGNEEFNDLFSNTHNYKVHKNKLGNNDSEEIQNSNDNLSNSSDDSISSDEFKEPDIVFKTNSISKPRKPNPSNTSSFMELVRLKNISGLTKNLKVVDRLISNSKNKKFAYLTPVKNADKDVSFRNSNQFAKPEREEMVAQSLPDFNVFVDNSSKEATQPVVRYRKSKATDLHKKENRDLKSEEENSAPWVVKYDKHASNNTNVKRNYAKKVLTSKSSPSIVQSPDSVNKLAKFSKQNHKAEHELSITNTTMNKLTQNSQHISNNPHVSEEVQSRNQFQTTDNKSILHSKKSTENTIAEKMLPASNNNTLLSIPAKQMDKFLQSEKMKTMNYKSDITWQQSLAAIKDVHYIYNKNDFDDFARDVLTKAEEKFIPLSE